MASGPIGTWQVDGQEVETVADFIFFCSKIIVDGDCSQEIQRHLLLWQKSCGKPRQCIKKQRHHFANKGLYSQNYSFSSSQVWLCEFYHKEGKCWRIDVSVMWCWRRLLRVPWTARSLNYSIIKEANPGYLLEGLMLRLNSNTLATWCEELTHWKRPWCWERLRAGGEKGDRGWDDWMASPIQWTWTWANSWRWWGTGRPGMLQSMGSQQSGMTWRLNNSNNK